MYTIDEGQTWETLKISDKDIVVTNVIIEPNSISQQFIIYGTYANSEENQNLSDNKPSSESKDGEANPFWSTDSELSKDMRAFLTYVDFSALHTRQCKGADEAG